jgi:hypothetical protein
MRVPKRDRIQPDLIQAKYKYDVPTSPDDPTLPAVFVFSGARGSGKTYACVAMCKKFEEKGYITRTFLISPTRESNTLFDNLSTLQKSDTCDKDEYGNLFLKHVMDEVKNDWQEYETYKKYKKALRKQMEDKPLTIDEEYLLEEHEHRAPTKVQRPGHMLLVDDCQGTNLFSSARRSLMTHMVIKHRHIPISIAFMMQTWIGLPRPIRLNTTQFMVYKTHDKNQLYQLYQSFGNLVTWNRFNEMYQQATSSPHGFLYIDTAPKTEQQRFRNGFNEYFTN